MDKIKYFKKLLKESVDEIVSGFDDFEEWKTASSKRGPISPNYHRFNPEAKSKVGFVYHFTNADLSKMSKEGAQTSKEFRSGQVYGRGIYAMLKFKPNGHGNGCMRYAVKPGTFDKFILFNIQGSKEYLFSKGLLTRRNETLDENIKRLVPKDIYDYLLREYNSMHNYSNDLNGIRQGEFYKIMTMGERYLSENRLDATEIEGWDYSYGDIGLVFRSSDLLLPYKYYTLSEIKMVTQGIKSEDECGTFAINNEDEFKQLNYNVDAFRRGHVEYPQTDEQLNSVKGFAKLKKRNKYNLINNITGKPICPIPMDSCSNFDAFGTTAKFSAMGGDWEIESPDYGHTINIYLYPDGYNGRVISMTYEQFLQVSELYKQQNANRLNESFMVGDYADFQKRLNNTATFHNKFNDEEWKRYANSLKQGKDVVVYTCSSRNNKESLLTNGMTYEFSGTGNDNSMYHGLVAYCALSISGAINNQRHGYGDTIYSFILKDGLKDFIIWDDKIRSVFAPKETAYDNLVRLIGGKTYKGKSLYEMFDEYIKKNTTLHSKGIYSIHDLKKSLHGTGPLAAAFYDCFKGRYVETINQGVNGGRGAAIHDEFPLAQTNIRGYVYNGGTHHDCICIRDFNALMPIGYSDDGGRTFKPNPYMNEEVFNRLNDNVHPYFQYRKEYGKTPLLRKQTCGYTLVEGPNGFNFMYVKNHKRLLPVDADKASAFNPVGGNASFTICNAQFDIFINSDKSIELTIQGHPLDFNTLMNILNQAKERGMLGKREIYTDCMLNPNNQK